MNYIKELNAFFDCVEREPLSGSAVSLWNTLLHINNKTAWSEEFSVAGTVLKLKGGLTDSSFKRARKELEERGFIEHRSRGTRLAPIYKMKRLHLEFSYDNSNNLGQLEESMNQSTDQVPNHHKNQMTAPLNKINKTKEEDTKQYTTTHTTPFMDDKSNKSEIKGKSDAIIFYRENFGPAAPFISREILSWINKLGDEMVIEGMKRALERGKVNFGYVKGILRSWEKQGISSVEMLKERESKHPYRAGPYQNRSTEVVPDWCRELKQKQKEKKREALAVEGRY